MIQNTRVLLLIGNVLIIVLFISYGCTEYHIAKGTPVCIKMKINWIAKREVASPPASVYRYRYDGKEVYYIPAKCCDIPSQLYDADCNYICSPDGGFSGSGDGKCSDFFSDRTDEKLIWEDERQL